MNTQNATPAYAEFDIPYATVDGSSLVLHVTKPVGQGSGPFPVLLDFHGGAWTHFDHRVDLAWCRELAKNGVMCASVQFRLAPEHPWPAFIADARAALRWLTAHGAQMGADVSRLGTIGGSTGGFLSILLGMSPRTETEAPTQAIDTPDTLTPAMPRVAIGFYPILDVVGRYQMVSEAEFSTATHWLRKKLGPPVRSPGERMQAPIERLEKLYALKAKGSALGNIAGRTVNGLLNAASSLDFMKLAVYEELKQNHEGAFTSVAAMHDASPLARAAEGRVQNKPAVLIIQGRHDINLTPQMSQDFVAAYRRRGGVAQLEIPAGFPHAFATIPSPQSDYAIRRTLAHLIENGLLDVAPATAISGRGGALA
jgi:acetyl esterase/lipase